MAPGGEDLPDHFNTDRLCTCESSPPGFVSSEDDRFCGYCKGVLDTYADEFGLGEEDHEQ